MLKLTKKQVNAVVTAASTVLTRKVDDEIKNVRFVPDGDSYLEAMAANQTETVGIGIDAALDEEIVVPLYALTSYKLAKPDDDFYAYFDGNCVYCGPESDMAEYPAAKSEASKPSGLQVSDFDIKTFLTNVREIAWGAPKKDAVLYFSDRSVYTQDGAIMVWSSVDGLPIEIPFGSILLTSAMLKSMPVRGEGKIGYNTSENILYLQAGKFWYSVNYTREDKTDIVSVLDCVCGYENLITFSDPHKQAKELREILAAFPSGSPDHAALKVLSDACAISIHLDGVVVDFPLSVDDQTFGAVSGKTPSDPVISLTLFVNALEAGFSKLSFGDDPSTPIVFEKGDTACIILPIDPAAYTPEDVLLQQGGF
jgi:hypothetical protein